MVEVNGLSKDAIIANLWLTDEMINEIEIVKREIDKKKASLDSTIVATEQEHLKAVETKYYDSSEYRAHQDYNGLIEKLKDFIGVAILIALIVCVLLSYALIIFNVNFLYVILLFIIFHL